MADAKKPVHHLGKKEILRRAVAWRDEGKLYDLSKPGYEEIFTGSIDRFCEIAYRLRNARKVLDIGASGGMLVSLLRELGHDCCALDICDMAALAPDIYQKKHIEFKLCNVEVDEIPYPANSFDAVVCCQTMEHFTHSHLPAVKEMHRVLKVGGMVEIDVPNAVCFRNRSRMLRGKHITWDYAEHYLFTEPILYKGMSFFPGRHNRDFVKEDLRLLLEAAEFRVLDIYHLKSTKYRGRPDIKMVGTFLRDMVPSLRKSLIAFGEKVG